MAIEVKSVKTPEGENFIKSVKSIVNTSARVGWFGLYPPDENGEIKSVGQVAIQNEFGGRTDSGHIIPPRPFLRPTIDAKRNSWMKALKSQLPDVLMGKKSMEDALLITGEIAKGDIQKTINSIWSPPLAQYTIKQRMIKRGMNPNQSIFYGQSRSMSKSKVQKIVKNSGEVNLIDKPLIDTGIFFNTITTEIEKS